MSRKSPIRNINAWEKAKKVRLLILDVDGVLTDGCIVIDDKGKEGGRGAVREIIEFILKSQQKWAEVTARYHH